jgi:alcohol dehydrogenase
MQSFDYRPLTRIVFGPGSLDRLGELARKLGGRRVLVVTDRGIIAAGHAQRGIDVLRAAGLETAMFDGVQENPTTVHVDAGLQIARQHNVDLLVGLGGGSSMDCAKGINFLYSNGGRMADYWGVGKATKPMLPMVAVPTTAGTGSECQSFALIADPDTHQKMACGDRKAACRIALLDPELTLSLPRKVTAASGVDALAHALETHVTRVRNPVSQLFSREAWRLLAPHLPTVLSRPDDLEVRGAMHLGASLAGLAIENSMLGAAHACANPLTAHYGITHGVAIGLMLPPVIRFNGSDVGDQYAELIQAAAVCNPRSEPSERIAQFVEKSRAAAELPARLADCGVPHDDLPKLAAEAARQWTAGFNPRPVDEAALLELYQAAF